MTVVLGSGDHTSFHVWAFVEGILMTCAQAEVLERSELVITASPRGLAEQFTALGEEFRRARRGNRRRGNPRWCWALVSALVVSVALAFAAAAAGREHRKLGCRENVRQLGAALVAYQESRGHLPAAAITDPRGQALLSWRVAILPSLGCQELYDAFRLDEPWNSPHNLALLPRMPAVFGCPSEPARRSFLTTYHVIVGPEDSPLGAKPLFDRAREVDLREVLDGTSNTLMVVETNRAVPWTEPDDLFFADGQPMPQFGSRHTGGFHAAFGDGSVRFLKFTLESQVLRALITRDGAEVTGDS
jgi:prepilin-type processing-associated H-X9-DG protein